jgi:hypothetical protein
MQDYPTSVPIDAVQNTKFATTLLTLGLQLQKPGIFVVYSKENPVSSGGTAFFIFETNLNNLVQSYLKIWDENIADVALDEFLEKLKTSLPADLHKELETKIAESLITYGNKLISNYQIVVRDLRKEIPKFVLTGGEPVYCKGQFAGIQNFNLQGIE